LRISYHNRFRVLCDKIASAYFIWKIYLYFNIGNGQPREPALCQLYRHTFVPYTSMRTLAVKQSSCSSVGPYCRRTVDLRQWRPTKHDAWDHRHHQTVRPNQDFSASWLETVAKTSRSQAACDDDENSNRYDDHQGAAPSRKLWRHRHGGIAAVKVARGKTPPQRLLLVALLEEYVSALRAPVRNAARAYRYRVTVTCTATTKTIQVSARCARLTRVTRCFACFFLFLHTCQKRVTFSGP